MTDMPRGKRHPDWQPGDTIAYVPATGRSRNGHVRPIRSGTIQWLNERNAQKVRWLWTGYLPRGCMVMVDGEKGQGKTLSLYDIAARLTTNRPMPDGSHAMNVACNVLVLAPEEMVDAIIVPRLTAAGADLSRIAIPRIKSRRGKAHEMFLLPDSAGLITGMVNEADAKFLIIDPITSFLMPHINSNNDPSVRSALAPLAAELGETDCCAPMVRHMNKNTQMAAKHRGGGSVAFAAIARVHLITAELPEDYSGEGRYALCQVDTNLTKRIDEALTYSIVDSNIELDDEGHMVPKLEWHGLARIDVNTLTQGPTAHRGPSPDTQDECIAVLQPMFDKRDSWPQKQCIAALKAAGIKPSNTVIEAVKKRMGIRSRPVHRRGAVGGIGSWDWTVKPLRQHVSGTDDDE